VVLGRTSFLVTRREKWHGLAAETLGFGGGGADMKRVKIGLVVVAGGLALAMMTAQGCGGTEEVTDAGTQPDTSVADTSVADTSAPPRDAGRDTAPTCDPNADPFRNVQDAAVGDSGLTTGLCAACVKTECKSEVAACVQDCDCQGPITRVLECALKPGSAGITLQSLAQCAGAENFPGNSQTTALAIGVCIQNECSAQCIPSGLFDSGTDAADGGG